MLTEQKKEFRGREVTNKTNRLTFAVQVKQKKEKKEKKKLLF